MLARERGDPPGEIDVAPAHPEVVVADRDQPNGHAIAAQVDVGVMVIDVGELTDRADQPGSGAERLRAEERVRAIGQDAPVLDAVGLAELARGDPVRTLNELRATGAFATSPMICASSVGRDHIGQWLVGRSTQVAFRSSGMPARNDATGSSFA